MSYTTVVPSETFFQLLPNSEEETPTETEESKEEVTADAVKQYAKDALNPDDYKLFYLRFIMELTLRQTGEYIGRSTCYVVKHTDNIKSTISNHFQTAV